MNLPLVHLIDLVQDIRPGFASGDNTDDGVVQVRMNNLDTTGNLNWEKVRRVSLKNNKSSAYFLKPGDVLFNCTNSPELVGKTALFTGFNEPVVFSNHFLRIRTKPERLFPAYLARWLVAQHPKGIFQLRSNQWVNQATFRQEDLLAFKIPLPPLEDQKRIAVILDKADAIRRKRQQAIKLADDFLHATFLDMFGDPVTNPKKWATDLLGDYCDMETGFAFQSKKYKQSGIRLCRGINVLPQRIDWSDVVFCDESDNSVSKKFHLEDGDIVLAMDRPWISTGLKVARICENDLPGYLVQRVARLRGIKGLTNDYIYFLLLHPSFTHHCNPKKTETTIPHISPNDIRSYLIPLPPEQNLLSFTKIAKKIMLLIAQLKTTLLETNIFINSLTQRAFRGEL